MLENRIPLDFPIREVVAYIGVLAQHAGNTQAAERCLSLSAKFSPEDKAAVQPTAVELLCALADHLRAEKKGAMVDELEAIISSMKSAPRILVGSINYTHTTVSQADDAYETIRKIIAGRG